jgi:agmatinase
VSFDPNAAASGEGIFGLPDEPDAARVVLVPVPFEATTSYGGGAADGPGAIRIASRQVDLFDVETGRPYEAGISMLHESTFWRAWSEEAQALIRRVRDQRGLGIDDSLLAEELRGANTLCVKLNDALQAQVESLLGRGKLVGTVGGDHGAVFGAIAAHAARYPGLGILHFDAHCDLRPAYEGFTWSHASIMNNVVQHLHGVARLVQVGIRDFSEEELDLIRDSRGRIRAHFDVELACERFAGTTWKEQCARIVADLPAEVYVSFDVDGLDPALCPHTGTPVPGGLSFHEASYLVGEVAHSGRRIVGFDLVEVAPDPAGSEWDANIGARLLYKLVGWMLVAQPAVGSSARNQAERDHPRR